MKLKIGLPSDIKELEALYRAEERSGETELAKIMKEYLTKLKKESK